MGQAACDLRIGTSGWHYDHWLGTFYPEKLPKTRWLEYYSRHFNTVEINSTFYHLPLESTVRKWRQEVPEDFRAVVKASRYITHIKKLRDTAEEVRRFLDVVSLFGDVLGPVLVQLPPSLHQDLGLLEDFLQSVPPQRRVVFEFRHPSWYGQPTLDLLDGHQAGFCVHDMQGMPSLRVATGGVVYVRFHGTSGHYAGSYTDAMLADWAAWIRDQTRHVYAAYAYFNNDVAGHAIRNATTLRSLLIPE